MPPQSPKNAGAVAPERENADDSQAESDPSASPSVRQLKEAMILIYSLAIYNAQIDKTTGKPQLTTQVRMFREGKQVLGGKETPLDATNAPDLKRLTMTGAIHLGSVMPPGEYVLQVIVTDALGKEKYRVASQWTDFEVVK